MPTASEIFDLKLPASLAADPAKGREINAVYLMKITGDGGGVWTVDLAGDPPACVRGETKKAECTIEVAHADFLAMLATPALAISLFSTGKLKVAGNPMLAMKLQKLFQLA
jgi:putative sterol carrier protein